MYALPVPTRWHHLEFQLAALDVRTEYFFRPTKVQLEGVEYRKRASTPQKVLARINGDVLDQAERWHELLGFYPDSVKPIAEFSLPEALPAKIDTLEQAEQTQLFHLTPYILFVIEVLRKDLLCLEVFLF